MREDCRGKGDQKSGHQIGIVIRLIHSEDQTGIHDIQKKIGDAAAAFGADKADTAAENPTSKITSILNSWLTIKRNI